MACDVRLLEPSKGRSDRRLRPHRKTPIRLAERASTKEQ